MEDSIFPFSWQLGKEFPLTPKKLPETFSSSLTISCLISEQFLKLLNLIKEILLKSLIMELVKLIIILIIDEICAIKCLAQINLSFFYSKFWVDCTKIKKREDFVGTWERTFLSNPCPISFILSSLSDVALNWFEHPKFILIDEHRTEAFKAFSRKAIKYEQSRFLFFIPFLFLPHPKYISSHCPQRKRFNLSIWSQKSTKIETDKRKTIAIIIYNEEDFLSSFPRSKIIFSLHTFNFLFCFKRFTYLIIKLNKSFWNFML